MSPSNEEHIELLLKEFNFEVEYVKPLTEVSFSRDNSGNDLQFHTELIRLTSNRSPKSNRH